LAQARTEAALATRDDAHAVRLQVIADRRHYRRFASEDLAANLLMVRERDTHRRFELCTLLNISYGGMCFRTHATLWKSGSYQFLLEIVAPFKDIVHVRARICWISAASGVDVIVGVAFVASSKGWLAPEEDFHR
jgi:hypothetical protein